MTTKIKEMFQVTSLDISEINGVFTRLANRIDKIEGYRGTPELQAPMTFAENATLESPTLNTPVISGGSQESPSIATPTITVPTIIPSIFGIVGATPTNLISWTSVTDWTDVDISSYTGDYTALWAILAVEFRYSVADASQGGKMRGLFRPNGSTETDTLPRINLEFEYGEALSMGIKTSSMIFVELDDDQIFETKLDNVAGSPQNIVYKVDLIGYCL